MLLTASSLKQKKITADIIWTSIGSLDGKTVRMWDIIREFLRLNWQKFALSGFCILLLFMIVYRFGFVQLNVEDSKKTGPIKQLQPDIALGGIPIIVRKPIHRMPPKIKFSKSLNNSEPKQIKPLPLKEFNAIKETNVIKKADVKKETNVIKKINAIPKMTHSVQVGAFLFKENAENRTAMLTMKGYKPHIVILNDSSGRIWHTVRIGNFPSREIAYRHAKDFSNLEKLESAVVPVDSL